MGKTKKTCSSICEVIFNSVISVTRSSATLKIANRLLATDLLEVSSFCKCSSFSCLTGESIEHSQKGLIPGRAHWGLNESSWKEKKQSQHQEKDSTARSKPRWKQSQRKTDSSSWILVQGKYSLLTVKLNKALRTKSVLILKRVPRECWWKPGTQCWKVCVPAPAPPRITHMWPWIPDLSASIAKSKECESFLLDLL